MTSETADRPSTPSHEMLSFSLLKPAESLAPRLGRLTFPGRSTISTPHYVGNTSRGVVPHLSQDNFRKHAKLPGVYVPLEDFIEKIPRATPPVYEYPIEHDGRDSRLRKFISLPDSSLLILGARRNPPVLCAKSNTNSAISILTSVGLHHITIADFVAGAKRVNPDVLLAVADIPFKTTPGPKRIEKMADRSAGWIHDQIQLLKSSPADGEVGHRMSLFAPLLPVSAEAQNWYLRELVDSDILPHLSGLAYYEPSNLDGILEPLELLPRLSLTEAKGPREVLYEISLGADMFVLPFIGAATDAGVALTFRFPPPTTTTSTATTKLPLGVDMWSPTHTTDVSPLAPDCPCSACTAHHRAYIRHLLDAKEMLGWTLLQLHNHAVLDRFFDDVRAALARGSFAADRRAFDAAYALDLPAGSGAGPRVRGYQFKSEGPGEKKRNPPAFRMLDEGAQVLEDAPVAPEPEVVAEQLERLGFAETEGRVREHGVGGKE